ncbi:MAG: hypothetical protein ACKOE7_00730, partial [Actinomycetota bacterium]
VVRRTADRAAAFREVRGAVNLAAEGTIIGDGRTWDTVQFVAADSTDHLNDVIASLPIYPQDEAFVLGVRASMDAITQG